MWAQKPQERQESFLQSVPEERVREIQSSQMTCSHWEMKSKDER
jgi:hypothetical protein